MKNVSNTKRLVIIGSIILALIILAGSLTPHRGKEKRYADHSSSLLTTGSNVSITEGRGNVYVAAERLSLSTPLTGDVYGLATIFSVTEQMFGDIGFVGETLDVQRNVHGDIRMLGDRAIIQQRVAGEIMFLGTLLSIDEQAVVQGNVTSNATEQVINGVVRGNVSASGDRLVIAGTVTGDVNAARVKEVVLTKGSIIRGSLTYTDSPRKSFVMEDGALVSGELVKISKKKPSSMMHGHLYGIIKMLIFLVVSSFLMYGLFFRREKKLARLPLKNMLFRAALGVGSVVACSILVIILAVTPGFGFVSFALLLSIMLLTLASFFASPILLGVLVQRLMRSRDGVSIKTVITGIATVLILVAILKPLAIILILILGSAFFGHAIRHLVNTTLR
ncbi:MAG: polymer-forming cytoskeletal protein [Candidatus Kaiserbacteria bacterium]|nr:polymer-forming cytoskeletal protein [Candidatus Kaiserbacteria bacterium]